MRGGKRPHGHTEPRRHGNNECVLTSTSLPDKTVQDEPDYFTRSERGMYQSSTPLSHLISFKHLKHAFIHEWEPPLTNVFHRKLTFLSVCLRAGRLHATQTMFPLKSRVFQAHLPPGFLEQDVLEHRPVQLPQLAARLGEHGGGPRLAVHERQVSEARLDLVGGLVHMDGGT